MAKAKVENAGVVVTLELSENEALYLYWALTYSEPVKLEGDPVHEAIADTLFNAGVSFGEMPDHLIR